MIRLDRTRTTSIRLFAVFCALTFVAAACSSSSDDSSGAKRAGVSSKTEKLACAGPAATGDPVTIGFMWPEGGQAINQPAVGESAVATVKYANACLSGIGGHPIQLDKCPEAEDQASITVCANQFIDHKVDAVAVSATGTPDAIATPVTQAGIPYTSANGVGSEQLNPKAYIWPAGAGGALGGMAAYAKDHNLKSVAVVSSDQLIGQLTAFATPAFDTAGVKFTPVGVPTSSGDITPQLRTALADNPGAIVVVGDETSCISFLQGMQALQSDVPEFLIQTCTGKSVVDAVGKQGLEGKILFTVTDANSKDPDATLYRAVMAKYAPDTDPYGFATFGYLSILGLVRASEGITGEITPQTLMTVFDRDQEHVLPLGDGIKFNCGKTYFQKPAALVSICSGSVLVGKVKNTVLADAKIVDVSPLFGG